ncbi:O-antigen ligase family protein [Aeromonas caviae]
MHSGNVFLVGKNAGFERFLMWAIFGYYFFSFLLPQASQFFLRILPLVIGFAIYVIHLFYIKIKLSYATVIALFFISLFSLLASSYLFTQFGFAGMFSMENLFFLSLPIFFIVASRLASDQGLQFIYRFFLLFLSFQLFVMLGQAMKMLTGIGFSTPAEYSPDIDQAAYRIMLSGTFMNANDLASLAVMIAAFFLLLNYYHGYRVGVGLAIVSVILLLTVSRMSIFLYASSLLFVWLCKNRLRLSKILSLLMCYLPLTILLFLILYSFIDSHSGSIEVFGRIKQRLDTILLVLDGGIAADNSISVRYESYLNFVNNLTQLGYGTAKLRDYGEFVSHLGSNFDLLAVNPHSFIVEIGYWLGWPGLILFGIFLLSAFFVTKKLFFVFPLAIFIMVSMISSSVFNNFLLFFSFLNTIFIVAQVHDKYKRF